MLDLVDIKYFKLAIPGPYNESAVDIAVKCPICGDSKHKKNSKRLHLYEKGNTTLVHCFNGDCELNSQSNLYNFLKVYKPELLFNYKNEKFKGKINVSSSDDSDNLDYFNNLKLDLSYSKEENSSSIELKTIDLDDKVCSPDIDILKYLMFERGLSDIIIKSIKPKKGLRNFSLGETTFYIKDNLIIPFYYGEKVYGFYSRSLKEKKFINFSLNKGFNIFNFFNVNLNEPVYIFESIFDALSFKQLYNFENIIALNTLSISKEALKLIKYPVFCLDNDNPGIKEMLKYCRVENSKFLIYPEDLKFKDFNEMLVKNFKFDLRFESGFNAMINLKKLL